MHSESLGVNVRAMAGKSWLMYAAGLDYQLGLGHPGDFLYETNLYPIGIGVLLGLHAKLGIRAGVGLSGIRKQAQFSAQLPAEVRLEFDLHRKVRVVSFARALWLSDNSREDGTTSFSSADEVALGFKLRWSKRYYPHDKRLSAGNGYFVGATYQEKFGVALIGVTLGYSLNATGGGF